MIIVISFMENVRTCVWTTASSSITNGYSVNEMAMNPHDSLLPCEIFAHGNIQFYKSHQHSQKDQRQEFFDPNFSQKQMESVAAKNIKET